GRLSDRFISALQGSGAFDVVGRVNSPGALRQAIVAGTAHVGFDIPENFSADILLHKAAPVQVLVDGSQSTIAQAAAGAASEIGTAMAISLDPRASRLQSIDVRPMILFNPSLRTPNFLVPGLIGLVLQNITMVLMALSVVAERTRGTLDQVLVTPIGTTALLLGKIVPYTIVGFLDFALVLVMMTTIFQVPIAGNLAVLLVLGAGFLMTSLGLGLLISTYAQSQLQALLMTAFFVIPSALLSGMFFQVELMPPAMRVVAYALPLTYFLEVLRGIIVRGATIAELWLPALATILFGLVALGLASLRFGRTSA
ncbi:MAG TPA: ABC transporter permease, partial [Candidatus Acidoferrales bacterium]|nr:ABC transporter permease [Candidatus Acidoferrales bacterium]